MVTMNGLNFEKVSFVKFNGVSANFIIHSPTLITAQVPPQTDSGPITLQNTSGDLTTSAIDFVLTKATDTGLILTNQPSLVLQNGNVDVVILVTNRGPSIATELRSVHTFPVRSPSIPRRTATARVWSMGEPSLATSPS